MQAIRMASVRETRRGQLVCALLVVCGCWAVTCNTAVATDFVITIGGGYRPSGNQASLEANVVFLQRILHDRHRGAHTHEIYFADGFDDGADLQIVAPPTEPLPPLVKLLAELHRQDDTPIEYRNHQVPNIAGANDPDLIRDCITRFAGEARSGDRVLVYVTAHGGSASRRDPYNTTINCWDDSSFSAREFTEWIAEFPRDVPVIMVMAQCYCGGFAHTIFDDADEESGLADHLRIGFFAQQHDLAAAGCRPDIDNDEEFSSFFWGAMIGQRRTGEPLAGCDANGDGMVSFDEAYAETLVASETIDIPLKSSDALLRVYSEIPDYRLIESRARRRGRRRREGQQNEQQDEENLPGENPVDEPLTDELATADEPEPEPQLHPLRGPLVQLLAGTRPATRRVVTEISNQLGYTLADDIESILAGRNEALRESRGNSRRGRRGRRDSGRREVLEQIEETWPELADRREWVESPLLDDGDQDQLLAELQALPSYEEYVRRRDERSESTAARQQAELRDVKYQRLIRTLESIVLAKNLPLVAPPEVYDRYAQMVSLEESSLDGR